MKDLRKTFCIWTSVCPLSNFSSKSNLNCQTSITRGFFGNWCLSSSSSMKLFSTWVLDPHFRFPVAFWVSSIPSAPLIIQSPSRLLPRKNVAAANNSLSLFRSACACPLQFITIDEFGDKFYIILKGSVYILTKKKQDQYYKLGSAVDPSSLASQTGQQHCECVQNQSLHEFLHKIESLQITLILLQGDSFGEVSITQRVPR